MRGRGRRPGGAPVEDDRQVDPLGVGARQAGHQGRGQVGEELRPPRCSIQHGEAEEQVEDLPALVTGQVGHTTPRMDRAMVTPLVWYERLLAKYYPTPHTPRRK